MSCLAGWNRIGTLRVVSPKWRRCEWRSLRRVAAADHDAQRLDLFGPLLLASAVVMAHYWTHPSDALATMDIVKDGGGHRAPMEIGQIAENEDFWANMARYSRFFTSVIIGTVYTVLKPLGRLLKNPTTAVAILGSGVVLFLFIRGTLQGMLGLNDLDM